MKKILAVGFSVVLLAASLFGVGAPVFIGGTTDYMTNSSGTISFVYSNRVRVIYSRGDSRLWVTNGIAGNTLWTTHGQSDESGTILQDYAFGTRGSLWQFLFGTNQASIAESSGNNIWNYLRTSGVLQFGGTGGIKVEGASVNLTNLPGSGEFVAIASGGLLFRTNVPAATLVTNFDGIVVTNGSASVISTATRTGGALTNITLNAQGPAIVHVDGSTNVNIVAMMNWAAGLQRAVTLLVTNRTSTVRSITFDAQSNNWIGMGAITGPISNTNAVWIAMENLGTSNVVYAAQYMSNPTN